jgi:chemotaxis protein MotB
MAAEKKTMIVIKKITISGGGHHGGAWKVAFADFMTAMMAFFLCMWLLSISPEARQSISDYFSTPSVIEYQFRNFGVELTLEKLFADLLNEPLDTVAKLLEPMDKTPNVFEFQDDKLALSYIADKVGNEAERLEINHSEIKFVIPDNKLFLPGTSEVTSEFISIMNRIKKVVSGLDDSKIHITSELYLEGVADGDPAVATNVATARLDLIQLKVKSSLEHETTEVEGEIDVKSRGSNTAKSPVTGFIHFNIQRIKDSKPSQPEKNKEPKESKFDSQQQNRDLYDELSESFRKEVRKK